MAHGEMYSGNDGVGGDRPQRLHHHPRAWQLWFDRLRPGDCRAALVDAPAPADGYVRVTDKQTAEITLAMGAVRP